jgi:hypothetical protein
LKAVEPTANDDGVWMTTVRAGFRVDAYLFTNNGAGLLDMLSATLFTGADSVVTRIVGSVIKWETLVVLLNHQPATEVTLCKTLSLAIVFVQVRGACVRVLCALLLRSPDVYRLRFLKSNGFELIGNQLREFPCTADIADCLFSLLCAENVRLEDG